MFRWGEGGRGMAGAKEEEEEEEEEEEGGGGGVREKAARTGPRNNCRLI